MTTIQKSVGAKTSTAARGFGSLPKRTQWAVLCLLLASVLAMVAPLLVSKITSDKANAVWNERQAQITLQREVIAGYQLQASLAESVFVNLQNQWLDKDLDESNLQAILQQASQTMQAFDTMANTLNSATYLAEDTIMFLHQLQVQMQARAMSAGQSGKEGRASYAQNHIIYEKVLWVNVPIGLHMSPNSCNEIKWVYIGGISIAALVGAILEIVGLGGAMVIGVCTLAAAYLGLHLALIEYGAEHKGVDFYLGNTTPIPTR
ncbi:MAG: hypothetical protein FWD76_06415 [Firmicutes bacterium]|nr:hypothetical protein [Bacillota bacterium]